MEQEKISANDVMPQGLNFQNTQTAHTTLQQKNKQPNRKMGIRP